MPERYLGHSLGKFRVDALVGSGGFAWVFQAWDPELEIPVALKVLKPQYAGDEVFEQRFRREASTAARLRHPNIVKIFAVGKDRDAVFFAMDFLPHGLAERLEVVQALPEDVVARLGADVASAIGFAHRQGVIHRDIKTDNILFDEHGNAVVADFGIARAILNYAQQTGTNMVVGTPQYFSPEQARGLPLDGRADIYSLGVTLFRAATGKLPFDGTDWYDIARQHVEERPPSPRALNRALSRDFERVVLRCLAKDPSERFATGEDLCAALVSLESFSTGRHGASAARTVLLRRAGEPAPEAPTGSGARRRVHDVPRAAWLGIGATALALAGILLYVRQNGESAIPPSMPPAAESTPAAVEPDSLASTAPAVGPGLDSLEASLTREPRPVLSVVAPRSAALRVDRVPVGSGSWETDTLAPGRHIITARVESVTGCPSAQITRAVTLPDASERVTARLDPRPCGTLRLDVQPAGATYRLRPTSGRMPPIEGKAPSLFPLILPVGTYRLEVEAPYCALYGADVTITAGQGTTRRVRPLCEDGEGER